MKMVYVKQVHFIKIRNKGNSIHLSLDGVHTYCPIGIRYGEKNVNITSYVNKVSCIHCLKYTDSLLRKRILLQKAKERMKL